MCGGQCLDTTGCWHALAHARKHTHNTTLLITTGQCRSCGMLVGLGAYTKDRRGGSQICQHDGQSCWHSDAHSGCEVHRRALRATKLVRDGLPPTNGASRCSDGVGPDPHLHEVFRRRHKDCTCDNCSCACCHLCQLA
eukprot:13681715-Alexandrium_andersonii.AAC.1